MSLSVVSSVTNTIVIFNAVNRCLLIAQRGPKRSEGAAVVIVEADIPEFLRTVRYVHQESCRWKRGAR